MTSTDIRATFLEFFEQHGHTRVASSSLVPADDPTLLFTNAGMNQFKDVFLGRESRRYTRAASAQKCMRVSGKHNDLDNVGPSLRHHTFFEMLGNFSFGDYFKAEAIRLAWTLLTDVWKMPPERLVVSVFKGDGRVPRDVEAYDIWRQFVPADRILELGADDNFWQMGETGPCGRCSEIYYVRGSGQDAEIEIWNNVFMEFDRSADGTLTPLPAPSIDTGMGLERITAVLQQKASNYDTDVFGPLLSDISALAGVAYGHAATSDVSMRVVADHIRATTFLIGDGVIPSNEWRGYVLRKIMRRAMRHGKHLGMQDPFLHQLVGTLVRTMGHAYPELVSGREMIERTILAEEHRFDAVLTDGLPRLEAEIAKVGSGAVLSGEVAFRLYDTFGIPFDFIEDTSAVHGVAVDRAGFETAMEGQRQRARAQSAFGTGPKKPDQFAFADEAAAREVGDRFEGYTATRLAGVPVVAMFDEAHAPVERLEKDARGFIALANTPFYAEAGGQVSDAGWLMHEPSGARAVVGGLVRSGQGLPRLHAVRVEHGAIRTRDLVTAEVDEARRNAIRRHHTATHLLHAALRRTLGSHVKQAGSLVAPDRLRFDFVHFEPIPNDTLERIEWMVNEQIVRNTAVQTEVRSTTEAIAAGAMALFGEKYGEHVRVVTVSDFSMELCGGTHVRATGDIGLFAILAESGVAAGVRRIEAVTGLEAVKWAHEQRATLRAVLGALHTTAPQALDAVERLRTENRKLSTQVEKLLMQSVLTGASATAAPRHRTFDGVELRAQQQPDLTRDQLRSLADKLREGLSDGIVIAATEVDGKPSFVVAVTPSLTARYRAGDLVKKLAPVIGGGGGGRPDFAEAGGKQAGRLDALLNEAERAVEAAVAAGGTQQN